MRVIIKDNYDDCSLWAANYVAYKIKAFRPTRQRPFVLGLPTGSTPLGMYKLLIEMVKEGKLACTPGICFGAEGFLRISYCYGDDVLREGMDRLERFLHTL